MELTFEMKYHLKVERFLKQKKNQNKPFFIVLNFNFLSNEKCFLSSVQFEALVTWKTHYSMSFLSKMAQVQS